MPAGKHRPEKPRGGEERDGDGSEVSRDETDEDADTDDDRDVQSPFPLAEEPLHDLTLVVDELDRERGVTCVVNCLSAANCAHDASTAGGVDLPPAPRPFGPFLREAHDRLIGRGAARLDSPR